MIVVPVVTFRPNRSPFRSTACAVAIACFLAAAACDDTPPEPQPVPGDLDVRLVSPNGSEGAAVLQSTDGGIRGISVEEGLQAFHWTEGGLTRIVLLRDGVGEIRFVLSVEDVNRPPRLEVVEVADGVNRLRASLAGYDVDVVPGGRAGS